MMNIGKVLVVDDDRSVRATATDRMTKIAARETTQADGDAAVLSLLLEHLPDLLLRWQGAEAKHHCRTH